jgi:hypothetical protein
MMNIILSTVGTDRRQTVISRKGRDNAALQC